MIREMGVSTITICCLCLASLSAANSLSREIEKGTLLTLLSKPVDKRSVILGKFFGILAAVFLAFVMMGIPLFISLGIRYSLDTHTGILTSFVGVGYSILVRLTFSLLQVAMMCAIAMAGSVYLSMVSNLSCCLFMYIIGNLINFFQDLFPGDGASFPWYSSIFCIFFPNMEGLSALCMGSGFPSHSFRYVALLTIYAILYITIIIEVTLALFESKECS